ncbi:serine/threonine protein kinase [Acrocarpospora catenulata]|uniref:serine/threonine protein kinase n=1 Tax=Acrocarpospora catenulata TaxID=2836182 RepID=UPI001BDA826C|nr:serine/threonine protein kinase [Acrocarpospora catenulata]
MVAQGTTLAGRYRLDVRIGAGGMGEVWRGEDTVLARTVAVKVLLPGRLDDPGFAVRFQGEARAMATVNHPGVVDVYDYGVTEVPGDGPTAYLVMRFVDGEPLDRLLSRLGRIGPEPAMELIAQAAAAIQAVHDRGIVHRDVKPGNLLVRPDGTLVLTDFGIARQDAASRLTDAGMVLGTAAYCAPEQAEGEPVTFAVDIYALGVVAYECVSGRRPFDGDTPVTIALKHIRELPPPLPQDVPPAIRHVVERALAKSPADRWPTAAAMSQAAQQAIGATGTATGVTPAFAPPAFPAGPPSTGSFGPQPYAPTGGYEQQTAFDGPITGITAQDFRVGGGPVAAGTTAMTPQQPGTGRAARRAAKKSRTGPIAMAAAGTAVFAGLAVFSINALNADTGAAPGPVPTLGVVSPTPSPSPSRTRRSPRPASPSPTPSVSEPSLSPSPSPSREPSERPSSPKPSPSPSPSPSKPAGPTKAVPALWQRTAEQATQLLHAAGFKPKVTFTGDGPCAFVIKQVPKSGELAPVGSTVTVLLKRQECPSSPTPSPSPSPAA